METLLDIPLRPHDKGGAVGGQAGVRFDDSHGKFPILFDRHDIDMEPLSDIQLPDGFSDPVVRDLYLEDRMVISQSDIIEM